MMAHTTHTHTHTLPVVTHILSTLQHSGQSGNGGANGGALVDPLVDLHSKKR